ncbi:MAG: hypothetical protein ACK4RK_21900 [Gemmataceae bacterium]
MFIKMLLIATTVLSTLILLVFSTPRVINQEEKVEIPTIEVWINDSINKLKGMQWKREPDGQPFRIAARDRSCNVVVHFPSGQSYKIWTNTLFLGRKDETVSLIQIVPLKRRVTFIESVHTMQQIMTDLQVRENPKIPVPVNELAKIKPREDIPALYATGGRIEKSIGARVVTNYDQTLKGWYVVLDITVPKLYGIHKEFIESDD